MAKVMLLKKEFYWGLLAVWFGFIGRGVSQGVGFEVSKTHTRLSVSLCLQPVIRDVKLSATVPMLCLSSAKLIMG